MTQRPKSFAFGTGAAHAPQVSSFKRFFSELSLTNLGLLALLALAILAWVGFFAVNQITDTQLAGRRANIKALIEDPGFVKNEQDLLSFDQRVNIVHKALLNQSHISNVLGFLEQYTHRQVQWVSFNLSAPTDKRSAVTDEKVKPIFDILKSAGQVKPSEVSVRIGLTIDEAKAHLMTLVNAGWARAISEDLFGLVPAGRTVALSGMANSYQTVAEQLVAFTNVKSLVSRAVTNQLGLSQNGGVTFDVTLDITPTLLERPAEGESQAASALITL